ncbi:MULTISPECIES: type IV pilus secretin PilQ [Marichromatium]|uniref:Type IV pilus assembly protein PilQ n=1 Tax=Marichromatium gracile TaxID=1048 RepID=A0A4R4AKH0_MARGR|nr:MULTISPECIES: type IV pilus secretin PilQ [Marichromatium]MBO8085207.1 type IV pilus secretin PilQ [Marichromatium sp.]MBK1707567.1 pilus assembly protein PilQ [Marichromatium gracile]RNE91963.1 type IV pilus secretin PilQ [Marichromatium sp. AB31]RNE92916.1 type IV pilus secretin PilQ [Marichromatium sp. AB32]TCW39917.1 type IV pilus assembly protein PilQ [Marichromatium gracile]
MNAPSQSDARLGRALARGVRRPVVSLCLLLLLLAGWSTATMAVELRDVQFAAQPGNRVEIQLELSAPVSPPETFATDAPARIALDFPGVSNGLDERSLPIGIGSVHSLVAVEASNRTRVVINLSDPVPYRVSSEGNRVRLIIETQADAAGSPPSRQTTAALSRPTATRAPSTPASGGSVRDIDFRRGAEGEGRVLIRLPNPETRVTVREQGRRVMVELHDTSLPRRLFRRLDVVDFATPVVAVESRPRGRNVEVAVETGSDYDYMAYQTDDLFTLDFRPLTAAEKEEQLRSKVVYEGERLSLNFQDIEVRAVLQVLADFTDLNLVASDTVTGNITLRLKNVPWDQALDIILKTKGLSMRRTGNVIMVAPTEEIASQEELEMRSMQKIEELAPLRSEFIQVNYAKAADLARLLKSEENQLLTKDRGNVTVDERTNTLLVQDTAARLEDIRGIVTRLDVPVRQVMIESRVVIAESNFARDLGVRFGLSTSFGAAGGNEVMIAGAQPGTLEIGGFDKGPFGLNVDTGSPYNSGIIDEDDNQTLMVDLAAPNPSGAVNFLIGKVGSYLLQLELSAMQQEGRGEIISSPRVITSDQHQATIKVGQQIPYQTVSQNGTQTQFKDAVLQLDVTPHITPDDRVIMDLLVNKDAPNYTNETDSGIAIDTRSVETSVLVDNGETVVLGGVYERTRGFKKEQVPWLGDIPVVGRLFKQELREDNNSELLIFVTPKILRGDLARR